MAWKKIIVSGSDAELASANIAGTLVTQEVNANTLTGSLSFSNVINTPNLHSSSAQVDITGTDGYTTFSSSISQSIAAKPSTWETLENKPAGIVSGSEQIVDNLVNEDVDFGTGDVTANSFYGDGSNLSNLTIAQSATVVEQFSGVTTYTVTHNFGSKNILVTVYDENDFQLVPASIQADSDNTATFTFDEATTGKVIVGQGGHIVSGSVPWDNITLKPDLISGSAQLDVLFADTDTSQSIDTRITDLESFSASLDSGFVTEAELSAATSSLSGSAHTDRIAKVNVLSGSAHTRREEISASIATTINNLSSTIIVSGSDGTGDDINLVNDSLTITGTSNEIKTSVTNNTVTVGFADNPTVSGNLTVTGNLNVTGDTIQAQVTNLNVEDRFILLNSGSTAGDAGIIFGGSDGSANEGSGIFWDAPANVFGFSAGIGADDTTATHTSKLGNIQVASSTPSTAPSFQGVGTVHVDTSDEGIWIYS